MPAITDIPLEQQVDDLLVRLLEAIETDRPVLLFAIYPNQQTHRRAENQLLTQLYRKNQVVQRIDLARHKRDWPLYLTNQPGLSHTVFLVSGFTAQANGRETLADALFGIRYDYFALHGLRVVFWLSAEEASAVFEQAPKLWAQRDQADLLIDHTQEKALLLPQTRIWPKSPVYMQKALSSRADVLEQLVADRVERQIMGNEMLRLRFQLGLTLTQLERYGDALDAWLQLLEIANNRSKTEWTAAAYNGLGNVYRSTGRHRAALNAYRQSIAIESRATAWYGLGNVYLEMQRTDDAIGAYQKAIALEPDDAFAYFGKGNAHFDNASFDEALSAYRQALAIGNLPYESAHVHLCIGAIYHQRKQIEEATAAFEMATRAAAFLAAPAANLGDVYAEQGRMDEALAAYLHALELDGESSQAHSGAGQVYRALGQLQKAIDSFERAVCFPSSDSHRAADYNRLGNAFLAAQMYPPAIAAFHRAVDILPETPAAYYGLGTVYARLRRYEAAIFHFEKAAEFGALSNNRLAVVYNGLGNVFYETGRYDDAVSAYRRAVKLSPHYARPYNGLGAVFRARGEYDQAAAAYRQAIRYDAAYALPYIGLGTIYHLQGNYEEALVAYRQAISLRPEHGMAYCSLAALYRKLDQREQFDKVVTVARDLMVEENPYNRACFAAICGDVEQALLLLQEVFLDTPAQRNWAKIDPDLSFLFDDPRFQALVR